LLRAGETPGADHRRRLNVISHKRKIKDAVVRLQARGIQVALFIDPVKEQIECAKETGAHGIEITLALIATRQGPSANASCATSLSLPN
jgi:pyridoxine 5'-phosphate synthase PdxJ